MSMIADAEALAVFGQKLIELQSEFAGFANKATNGFPERCNTSTAKQVFEQANRLSALLRQCAELAGQTGAVAKQEAQRIKGG